MKKQQKLIKEYYESRGITHSSPLLFTYFTKNRDGKEIVEYWAAKYGRPKGKKEKEVVSKLVMRFNPDTYRYSMSDHIIRHVSWSCAAVDHLTYHFYGEVSGCQKPPVEIGSGKLWKCGNWKRELMPTSEIPLNGCGDGKYRYCKYAFKDESISSSNVHSYSYWGRNPYGNLPDFLRKFNLNPQAMEMFAARGLVKFMKEPILVRLRDDKPFAKWYRSHALATLNLPFYRIEAMARRDIGVTDFVRERDEERRLKRERERRKFEREHREEIRRKRIIEEKMKNELAERKQRILDLYTRLKSICGMFGAYEVVVPKSEAEMRREGKRMHNCVGKMYPCRQGIDAIVVFLHRNGKPFVDIEIDPFSFKVNQCRKVCNADADFAAHKKANEIAAKIREVFKKAA